MCYSALLLKCQRTSKPFPHLLPFALSSCSLQISFSTASNKKWSFENLHPCDLVYAFLSRSFRFFSHFWPVVWHLWRFISALITPTCNSAAKHQLYIEFEITCTGWYERATSQCVTKLKGKNTCGRFVFISNRSDAGKPFQTAPAHQLCILEGWYVFNRAPLQPLEIWLFLAFAHNIDHRVTKTIAPHTFKKFTRCASTVCLWHNI